MINLVVYTPTRQTLTFTVNAISQCENGITVNVSNCVISEKALANTLYDNNIDASSTETNKVFIPKEGIQKVEWTMPRDTCKIRYS